MQTFLPCPSFNESARCLDYRRLGKQRVECKQILLALGVPVGEHQPKPTAWANHPAARMWRGHEFTLVEYAIEVCHEWIRRGYNDTLLPQFKECWWQIAWSSDRLMASPNWIGYDAFHASHRSNLLRKDRQHYGRFGWKEPADLEYVWPVEKEVAA
jgi:hypothetical protein